MENEYIYYDDMPMTEEYFTQLEKAYSMKECVDKTFISVEEFEEFYNNPTKFKCKTDLNDDFDI